MRFINAGFGNLVAAERIISIASPDAAPIKRMVQDGKESGRVIDVSCGKKTKSVLFCDSDHIILSALSPEKLLHAMGEDTTETEEE
ncbi:MAG: DUF370 domain-containing protein [Clostridia bacterium]|nr:DUF370 domain-containing protein [Clostridia bacterium]